MFKKRKQDGVVINTGNFKEWTNKKQQMKTLMKADSELKHTKGELANVKKDLSEIKELLKNLLNEKR